MPGLMNSLHHSYVKKARSARKLGKRGIHRVRLHPKTHEVLEREHTRSCWCWSRDFVLSAQKTRCPAHGNVIAHAKGRKDHGLGRT